MSVEPTTLYLSHFRDEFEQALEIEDQKKAEQIVTRIEKDFKSVAEDWALELYKQNWYCDMCDGERLIESQHDDDLLAQPCPNH